MYSALFSILSFLCFFVSFFVNLCESMSTDTCRMPSTSLLCARSSRCTFSRWMVHTVHRCAPSLTWSVVSSCVSSFANVECASSAWRRCWGKTWRDAEGLSGTAENIVDWTLTARPFSSIDIFYHMYIYNIIICIINFYVTSWKASTEKNLSMMLKLTSETILEVREPLEKIH